METKKPAAQVFRKATRIVKRAVRGRRTTNFRVRYGATLLRLGASKVWTHLAAAARALVGYERELNNRSISHFLEGFALRFAHSNPNEEEGKQRGDGVQAVGAGQTDYF